VNTATFESVSVTASTALTAESTKTVGKPLPVKPTKAQPAAAVKLKSPKELLGLLD
jgi:hypothetical protein